MAALAVVGHENEHVTRAQEKASENGQEAVSTVQIHTDICPE
jgi:hypothetical protein